MLNKIHLPKSITRKSEDSIKKYNQTQNSSWNQHVCIEP